MSTSLADVSARRSKLTPQQRALLEARLRGQSASEAEPEKIGRRPAGGNPPLSFAQQRLWFLDQWDPGDCYYNVPRALRFHGELNLSAIERSLTEIARRHESLRTSFPSEDGEPMQVIAEPKPITIIQEDLSHLPEQQREETARKLMMNESAWRFDLANGPLLRVKALRMGEGDHLVLFTMHHIITDGWSMGILVKEIAALYDAFLNGKPSPLPELPIQYADFSYWQRQQLQGESLEKQLGYWRKQLGGAPTILDLPTDRPRPQIQTHRGNVQPFSISKSTTDALKKLGSEESTTLFMTLLAAFETLLFRYTNQQDILVGTPIANRNREEIEGLIGFFVNTLVLRANFAKNPTFRDVLKQSREATLGAYAHQDLPFERLVEELQPERNLGQTPLFQVMFILQNIPSAQLELSGVTLSAQGSYSAIAKFDISWTATETEQGVFGGIEYSTDLFDQITIERMARNLSILLESIVANPNARVCDLQVISDAEKELVLNQWNATEQPRDRNVCAHRMFERQVERTPGDIAVIFDDERLTYFELNRRANRLASYLRKLGIGPESRVAISLERSTRMMVAVLGTLKSGAAYVPIDPTYPLERKVYMLEDSQAHVLLTERNISQSLRAPAPNLVCLDMEDDLMAPESEQHYLPQPDGENTAYVIYTSGSTGRPKGIAMPHRALANLIEWHERTLLPAAKTLQFASLSFDASFHEMFATWATGGTLALISEMDRLDPQELVRCIDSHQIEKIILPVVMFHQIAQQQAKQPSTLNSLKEITTTGEQLQITEPVRDLMSRLIGCRLHNHYGPSESHVVTAYSFDNDAKGWASLPPIGKPISNTRMYVLDDQMQAVPVGVAGEVYIAGENLARGYQNRPDLTAEKFIPDLSSRAGGERLYKTGDIGRYTKDGNIEYLRRMDEQVKIRGYRVELGEIESLLIEHAGVAEAVVVASEDETGDKRLVAYVVANDEAEQNAENPLTANQIRAYIKERVPEYMVPSAVVMMKALPVTSNGKVDRKALPKPERMRADDEAAKRRPSNEVEAGLAEVWERVLGVEAVGVGENFFELGGHSLKATQVVTRVEKQYGWKLSLRDLFSKPTIKELSEQIISQTAHPQTSVKKQRRVEKAEQKPHYDLSGAQRRVWIVSQQEAGSRAYILPGAYFVEGEVNTAALGQAFKSVVERHESLRTRFINVDGEPRQVIDGAEAIEMEVIDLRDEPEAEQQARAIARREATEVFDLEKGPLVRMKLVRIADERQVILVTLHHIIADGWSVNVLMREMMSLYEAFREGRANPLKPLRLQHKDYAEWEASDESRQRKEEDRAYWREKLAGELKAINLGQIETTDAIAKYQGGVIGADLSEELTEELRRVGRERAASLYMVVMTGVYALLARYSGQEDIVIGMPLSGREDEEMEGQIGMYLNTVLLRVKANGEESLEELLAKVRETMLEAYEHGRYGYEEVVKEIKADRRGESGPLLEVMVTIQETEAVEGERQQAEGVQIREWAEWNGVSKNDLWIGYRERGKGLAGAINYNSSKYTEDRVIEIGELLNKVLEQMAKDPNVKIMDIELAEESYVPASPDLEMDLLLNF